MECGGGDHAIPRQAQHGRHPAYGAILGISRGLLPSEASVGNGGIVLAQAAEGGDDPLLNPNTPNEEENE